MLCREEIEQHLKIATEIGKLAQGWEYALKSCQHYLERIDGLEEKVTELSELRQKVQAQERLINTLEDELDDEREANARMKKELAQRRSEDNTIGSLKKTLIREFGLKPKTRRKQKA